MLDPRLNSSLTNTMSAVAVAQLLSDNLPQLIKINKTGSSEVFNISSALDLTLNLLDMVGYTYDKLVEKLTGFMTKGVGDASLSVLDDTIRYAILAVLNGLVSCSNNPIISDHYLDERTVSGRTIPAGEGFVINLDVLDLFNLFSKCNPTDKRGGFFYGDVTSGCTPSEVWKSGDLDTLMWYLINMVESRDMKPSNRKTYWDDRNPEFKDNVEENTDKSYSEMVLVGDDLLAEGKLLKKIFRIEFDDTTNNFRILLNPDKYKPKAGESDLVGSNKTIYKFNKDYIQSVRLLYPQSIIAGILDVVANGSITTSIDGGVSYSLPDSILETTISEIITKIINSDDTEVEDCYFTFSNDEYNALIREADLRRKGIIPSTGDTVVGTILDDQTIDSLLADISGFTSEATFQEQKTIIKNSVEQLVGGKVINNFIDSKEWEATLKTNYSNWSADDWRSKGKQLIQAFIKKIVESVITPKIVLIYLMDYSYVNGEFPKTELDFMITFNKVIRDVVIKVMDYLIEKLFGEAYDRIKALVLSYIQMIFLEQIQKYKDIIVGLVQNCTLNINLPSSTTLIGNIDNVQHADILETKSTPGDDNC